MALSIVNEARSGKGCLIEWLTGAESGAPLPDAKQKIWKEFLPVEFYLVEFIYLSLQMNMANIFSLKYYVLIPLHNHRARA